jgi:hypothetical protein
MFFGGGDIPGAAFRTGGGNGFHVYTTGFGPGMQFRAGRQRGGGPAAQRPAAQQRDEPHANIANMLLQLLPVVLIACLSLFRSGDQDTRGTMPGVNKYFSLTVRRVTLSCCSHMAPPTKSFPHVTSICSS